MIITQQTRERRKLPQLDKEHLEKPYYNILNDEKLDTFLLLFSTVLEVLSNAI